MKEEDSPRIVVASSVEQYVRDRAKGHMTEKKASPDTSGLLIPASLARERQNGGDVFDYRKAIHNHGAKARTTSKNKRATFRGSFTPTVGGPNRRARRAKMAGAR